MKRFQEQKKSLRGFSYSKNMVKAFHYTYSIKLSINLSFQKSVIRLSVSGWPCSRILVETKVNLWFTKLSQSILMMVCIFLHTHQRPTQLAKNIKKCVFINYHDLTKVSLINDFCCLAICTIHNK